MYVYTDGLGGESHGDYDNSIYWCLKTMKSFGPDDDFVSGDDCHSLVALLLRTDLTRSTPFPPTRPRTRNLVAYAADLALPPLRSRLRGPSPSTSPPPGLDTPMTWTCQALSESSEPSEFFCIMA